MTIANEISMDELYRDIAAERAVNKLALRAHEIATRSGWHGEDSRKKAPVQVAAWIALMHSELSEALEEERKGVDFRELYMGENGKPEGLVVELSDCVIRIFDACEALDLNLGEAIIRKMAYNETRSHRHGGKVL